MMKWPRVILFAFVFLLVAAPAMAFDDVPPTDVFRADIEWLEESGITRGCNPPTNSRFCPEQSVTRAQMASFLVRALDLPPSGTSDFTDIPSANPHRADIAALAQAGITRGCNPPSNSRYCPDQPVTRAQMATFLTRALSLPAVGDGDFTDIPAGNAHRADIASLADAGITRGCNPPTNNRFCPTQSVTRGQMAAFLHRALGSRGSGTLYVDMTELYAIPVDEVDSREYPTDFPKVTTEWDASVSLATGEYIHHDDENVHIHDLVTKQRKTTFVWPDGARLRGRSPLASPDGRMLVGRSDAGGGAVQVVDRTRTGGASLLAEFDDAEVVGWRWTPQSDLIVVVVTADTGGIIPDATDWAIVEVSRSDLLAGHQGEIPITPLQAFDETGGEPIVLDVSPDGAEILISVADTIHVMNRSGGSLHQLTSGGSPHSGGVFSPDGRSIAFVDLTETTSPYSQVGQVHIIPNHRGQPVLVTHGGPTMPVTGGGYGVRADWVVAWGE